jgi:hypothetical protein
MTNLEHNMEFVQWAIVKPVREGPTIPVQLHGGLGIPNRTITHAGTTTICLVEGARCIENASNTSSTVLSRIFHPIKAVNLRGIK